VTPPRLVGVPQDLAKSARVTRKRDVNAARAAQPYPPRVRSASLYYMGPRRANGTNGRREPSSSQPTAAALLAAWHSECNPAGGLKRPGETRGA
jgi:hypothetical protein